MSFKESSEPTPEMKALAKKFGEYYKPEYTITKDKPMTAQEWWQQKDVKEAWKRMIEHLNKSEHEQLGYKTTMDMEYEDKMKSAEKYQEKENDLVNHPAHYKSKSGMESIDVIEAFDLGFCLGNTIKYILRAGKKDPTKTKEDLEKAVWYLKREIGKL
jgi:hypothetical protein